jgi:predicted KAP-like P-loop ATPase/DNA-binding transcriptional regulator YiaG
MRVMTPKQVEEAANRDKDNRPLSPDDLARMKRTPQAKIIRHALGLSQEDFANRYRIPLGTLRDWEQGRVKPDQAAQAYLSVIARDPKAIFAMLEGSDGHTKVREAKFDEGNSRISSKGLLNDRPIRSESEDILGLASFADSLARSLTEMAPDDGLVISVEGEWGAGKTSALELAQRRIIAREVARELGKSVAELDKRDWSSVEADWNKIIARRRTHVVRFNPWNFSGQENLVKAFFAEIGAVIGHAPEGPIARAIKKITDYLPSAGAVIGGGIGAVAIGLPAAGVGSSAGRALGEGVQKRFQIPETLEAAKRELADALGKSGKLIIVIIDDLDRLLPGEMRAMFSLVKSLGDLPNVIYVLSFDRTAVTEALRNSQEPIETEFLEKIVQVQLKLPPPWESKIRQLFFSRLDSVVGKIAPNDLDRWQRAFLDCVAPYIQTPRDVVRFSNTLQVIWPAIEGDVDLTDLVLLTILQLFEPSIYQNVFQNIELLAGESVTFEDDKIFAARFDPKKAINPKAAQKALAHLFPRLARGWDSHIGDGTVHLRKREQRRICTQEYYRNYFLFGRDPDRLSRASIEAALLGQDPAARLPEFVSQLANKRSRSGVPMVAALLDQILEIVFAKPLLSSSIVRTILDLSDDLIRQEDRVWELFVTDNFNRLDSILTFGFEPLLTKDRVELVRAISSHPCGLTLAAQVIDHLAGQHGLYGGKAKPESERYVDLEIVEHAVRAVLARIRHIARDGTLLASPKPTRLIWIWRHWAISGEVRSWLSEQLKSDRAILQLAELLPNTSYRSGGAGNQIVRTFSGKMYEDLLDIDHFKKRLDRVVEKAGRGSTADRIRSEFLAAEEAGKNFPF